MTLTTYLAMVWFAVVVALVIRIWNLNDDLKRAHEIASTYKQCADVVKADMSQRCEFYIAEMRERNEAIERVRLYANSLPQAQMLALNSALRGYDIINFQHVPWTPPERVLKELA
jgi:hypothetical protein